MGLPPNHQIMMTSVLDLIAAIDKSINHHQGISAYIGFQKAAGNNCLRIVMDPYV